MKPLALHPENPHYFLFRNDPTILLTSAEHYGGVLNMDFDYTRYFKELESKGLNMTRIFSGAYVEDPKAFNITENTLAPKPERFIAPWARSSIPGYANGGNKFDLNRWDDAYFRRLKDFIREAGKRGVVVEYTLFCPYYEDSMWALSPLNAKNNVNGIGDVPRTEVLTLKHSDLVAVQERFVRKAVEELNAFDNLYFEICNEPYFGGVTMEWQKRIAETVTEAESKLPNRHLLAQNIANGSQEIEDPFPEVSVFNFHYAHPPKAVALNYDLNRVIADDETGFRGQADFLYRSEAWEFLLAGGGAYNNLDYSFTVDHPEGTFRYPSTQPGGGSPDLRRQLQILKDFIYGFDFIRMRPDPSFIKAGVPEGGAVQALAEPGRAYAIYLKGGTQAELTLELPEDTYRAEWWDTKTGKLEKNADFRTQNTSGGKGSARIASPTYTEDIALRIVALR
ncbi:MAG: hypothetical protein KY468_04960 [Armatimonadetes bacterium]|nr:hypothetical protein [Armatimonadota bacterium]